MKTTLLQDLSNLTAIPETLLKKLSERCEWIICDDLQEAFFQRDNSCEIDLGIGVLALEIVDDELHYKFIPSERLEKALQKTITSGTNPLVNRAEKLLADKIIAIYKDFM